MTHQEIRAEENINNKDFFFHIMKNRRSVRKYKTTPIPEKHILQIIDAARMAPTSGNQQPWKFLVIQDSMVIRELESRTIAFYHDYFESQDGLTPTQIAERMKGISEYTKGVFTAPIYIVVLTDDNAKWSDYNSHDGPLAAGYLLLAARAMGYGTVYGTDMVPEEITSKVLNIPEHYTRVCFIPLGVPEEWSPTPPKKDLDELIIYNKFQT